MVIAHGEGFARLRLGPVGIDGLSREADAQTTVRVLDSFPAGSNVTLAPGQNFYLRLAYSTDKPTHIWIAPFFRGREVLGRRSGSRSYTGNGEALAWFSVRRPGVEVDEIRIKAGDGRTSTTPVIATHAVRVAFGGSAQTGSEARPNWLVELDARDKAIDRQDFEARMKAAESPGRMALTSAYMIGMLALFLFSFAGSIWTIWHWRGLWRIPPLVWLAWLILMVAHVVIGRSHNLWPIEIAMWAFWNALLLGALLIARKLSGSRSAP